MRFSDLISRLLAIVVVCGLMYTVMSGMEGRLTIRLDKVAARLDKLGESLTDLDKRVARIEGRFKLASADPSDVVSEESLIIPTGVLPGEAEQ